MHIILIHYVVIVVYSVPCLLFFHYIVVYRGLRFRFPPRIVLGFGASPQIVLDLLCSTCRFQNRLRFSMMIRVRRTCVESRSCISRD